MAKSWFNSVFGGMGGNVGGGSGINTEELEIKINELREEFQKRIISFNGSNKSVSTILQEIFDMANGKINLVISDTLPQQTIANTQYWVKTYNNQTLANGRHIIATNNQNVSTYIGTTDVDLTEYLKKTNETNKLYGTDKNGEQKLYDADDLGKTDDLTIEKNNSKELQVKNDGITNDKLNSDIKIGSLKKLSTNEKNSVVGAINEINSHLFVSIKNQLLENEYNVSNLTFDENYKNELIKSDFLSMIMCHCELKTPITDLTVGYRKILELPFSIPNDKIKIMYKTKSGVLTNNSGVAEWFTDGGSLYQDKENFKNKKILVKKYNLDENGDAIQQIDSMGNLVTNNGLPVLEYTEIEIDSNENYELYKLQTPLQKGANENTWKVEAINIKTNYEYLYIVSLKILGCNINEEGKLGSYYTKQNIICDELSVSQNGWDGEYQFNIKNYEEYENETFAKIENKNLKIKADIPIREFYIKGFLSNFEME